MFSGMSKSTRVWRGFEQTRSGCLRAYGQLGRRRREPRGGSPLPTPSERPRASGKFLSRGAEKFFVRGVAYGAFAPNGRGERFPEAGIVARDFALMRRAGINTIQTYHVPSTSVLDEAHAHGLSIIVSVPWIEQ